MATIDDKELALLKTEAELAKSLKAARKAGGWLFTIQPIQGFDILTRNLPVGGGHAEAIEKAYNNAVLSGARSKTLVPEADKE